MQALIAMSGGVDSSVAAWLMQQQGYTCIGATMKLFENDTAYTKPTKTCCSLSDVEDARSVAYRLGMPYYVFDFGDRFGETVIDRFIRAYAQGYTPNPCIDCNRFLKFEKLLERMKALGLDCIVTGHYAQIRYDEARSRYLLCKGRDSTKDQSYVLYDLTQAQLRHIRFPVGALEKAEVRRIAQEKGFLNAHKPDSQDICFIPDGDYAAFIERYAGLTFPPGDFLNTEGQVIGRHRGIIHYTVGQRRGLGISAPQPLYVCRINAAENTVTLGTSQHLFNDTLTAEAVNLISVDHLDEPMRVTAKIRYRAPAQPALAWQTADGILHVKFDIPQRAITPGQAVVLYDGDVVVGGGRIMA